MLGSSQCCWKVPETGSDISFQKQLPNHLLFLASSPSRVPARWRPLAGLSVALIADTGIKGSCGPTSLARSEPLTHPFLQGRQKREFSGSHLGKKVLTMWETIKIQESAEKSPRV